MTHRRTWDDFPPPLRCRLEALLGEPVARTRSCEGGFSPSSAEILLGASGSALFVKAVRDRDNPASRALTGAEADVLAALPAAAPVRAAAEAVVAAAVPALAPVPALVDVCEEGEWFVLVTQAAPGALPKAPWTPAQLDQVLRALDDLQEATTPCPVRALRSVPDTLGPDLLGFEHVAADPPQDLEPWLADHLDELRASARRGIDALDGNTLCHADVRADNMLITDHGAVSFVDWAHASRGSRVSDALQLLSSVEDPDGTLRVNARIDVV